MEGAESTERTTVISKRRAFAQLILCKGCCCGRTDRGHPEVPVDHLKAAWKAGALNKAVQLTISGCVGPCDVTNVAVVVTPNGTRWYGHLGGEADYEALICWARRCREAGGVLPMPPSFDSRRFEWFVSEPDPSIAPQCRIGGDDSSSDPIPGVIPE